MVESKDTDKILKRVLIIARFGPGAHPSLGNSVGVGWTPGFGIHKGGHGAEESFPGGRGNAFLLLAILGNIQFIVGLGHRGEIEAIGYATAGEQISLALGGFAVVRDGDFIREGVGGGQGLRFPADGDGLWIGKKSGRPRGDVLPATTFP